ncbi:MAG: hypothetical protein J2P54_24750 [Bradyrhizobiaceae bacterium]|nr:hypothetical protein [Bradyrhizobiaceae bacterium]
MTRVTIFHNVARDEAGRPVNFDGYATGAPLVRVFEYDHPRVESVEQIAEHAFYLFNVDPDYMQPDDYEIARRYRDRELRSLSTGDVILADDAALAIEPIGFRPIEGGQLNEVHEEHYGTTPLQ